MVISLEKVLISDEVDPKCVSILQDNGIEVVKNTKLSKEELKAEIQKYDGLIVRSATKVTAEIIQAGSRLKIIGRAGTGVDNIDAEVATKHGVVVMNTPGGNTISAAEHTCTLIIALTRNLGEASLSMKEGKWDRKKFMGSELYGKVLAIIGLGRIGKEVALRMQAFGMKTIGYDPIIGADESSTFNTDWMPLEDLWKQADYITVHTPLISHTRNLINDAVLAKCKKGVRVINCARGGIVDEAALLRALESGQCGGAGLDVFVEEPPTDCSLAKHPKVIATPHLGANTIEAQTRVAEEIAQQFVDVVNGKSLFGAINAPALVNALSPASQPWVKLAERLGTVGNLLTLSLSVINIEVKTFGDSFKKAGSYLLAACLAGYLRNSIASGNMTSLPGNLNLVNSPVLAKQAGIVFASTNKLASEGPEGSLLIDLQGAGGEVFQLIGTVAGETSQLVSVQTSKFSQPATLCGNSIIFLINKPTELSDIIAAAVKDGARVASVSISELTNSQGFGVIGLSSPVSDSLSNLKQCVSGAYFVTL